VSYPDAVEAEGTTPLLVISPVVHYRHRGSLHAFSGYAREIDVWADLFDRVTIVAPCRDEPPTGDCLRLTGEHIALRRVIETGGTTSRKKALQLLALPVLVWQLHRAMRAPGVILVRCPGNLGLLGAILAPLHARRVVAKFAGQWSGYPSEPWTERLQRRLLGSRWWPGPVLVYGASPHQRPNVVPVFNSVLTAADVSRARRARHRPRRAGPLRVLFVSRLVPSKNAHVLIAALALLEARAVAFTCTIVGDGPDRPRLDALVARLRLSRRVSFAGGVPLTEVFAHYEQADVLVRASEAEGWPKVIAEGMAFGLVCIGSDRGLMPWMLGEGRGLVVPPGDAGALAAALERVANDPEVTRLSARAIEAWPHYSLDDLRETLRTVTRDVREGRGCAS
jgi:glycosyltransferase involved in cell wall biosynthesis